MKTFTIPDINLDFYQHSHSQSVSEDAFNLYLKAKEYINSKKVDNVLDLGCGNGIILLMLAKDFHDLAFTGVDILKELIDIAKLNFRILSESLKEAININLIVHDYGREIKEFAYKKFDLIISNPPYYKKGEGNISPIKEKAIARFESVAGQGDLLATIKTYLASDGKSFIVYPFSRKTEFEKNCCSLSLNILSCENVDYKNKLFDKLTSKDKLIFEIAHVTN